MFQDVSVTVNIARLCQALIPTAESVTGNTGCGMMTYAFTGCLTKDREDGKRNLAVKD